ncbi:MAG: hypothetical protein R2756_13545 [Bacteroidales bacterium]
MTRKVKWSTPVPIDFLNSEFGGWHSLFLADYTEVWFTRCEAGKRENKDV